jgi:hypothetical protein
MFRKQPNGLEIYFSWPSKTARIVPNQSVKNGIALRDNIPRALLGLMFLLSYLTKGEERAAKIVIGSLLLIAILSMVERGRYISRLEKVPLHISSAQFDEAYSRDVGMFGGVLLTSVGALTTALFLYLALAQDQQNAVPLFLVVPLIVVSLIIVYVGLRILATKKSNRSANRSRP